MFAGHFLGFREAEYEAALRSYVLPVAHVRGFRPYLEFPLEKSADSPARGACKKLDAVLFYCRQIIAIEFKTIRPDEAFSLENDIDKLKDFVKQLTELDQKNDGVKRKITAWLLVAWTDEVLNSSTKRTRGTPLETIKWSENVFNKGFDKCEKEITSELSGINLCELGAKARKSSCGSHVHACGLVDDFCVCCVAICVDGSECSDAR